MEMLTYNTKRIIEEEGIKLSEIGEYEFNGVAEDRYADLRSKIGRFRLAGRSKGIQKILRHFR